MLQTSVWLRYPDVPAIAAFVALSQGDERALSIKEKLQAAGNAMEAASPASSS